MSHNHADTCIVVCTHTYMLMPLRSFREQPSADTEDGCAAGNPAYLRGVFEGWSSDIHDIIRATRNDEIEQRDLYDRPPSISKVSRAVRAQNGDFSFHVKARSN